MTPTQSMEKKSSGSVKNPEQGLYEVEIAGISMKLRSSHNIETVEKLVSEVNGKIDTVMKSNSGTTLQNALLVAFLHMAEDQMLLKKNILKHVNSLEDKALGIMSQLESSSLHSIVGEA